MLWPSHKRHYSLWLLPDTLFEDMQESVLQVCKISVNTNVAVHIVPPNDNSVFQEGLTLFTLFYLVKQDGTLKSVQSMTHAAVLLKI